MPAKKKAEVEKEISSKLRIKLRAFDHKVIDKSAREICETALRYGVEVSGPVPLRPVWAPAVQLLWLAAVLAPGVQVLLPAAVRETLPWEPAEPESAEAVWAWLLPGSA